MISKDTKTVALFIDAENLYFIQKNLGWEIDFEKMYDFFASKANLYNAFYYTAVDAQSEGHAEKIKFIDSLGFLGYTVRKKELKIINIGKDKVLKKGNLDVEIVIDMFTTKDLYEKLILFSGDSDFVRALEVLRSYGKEIVVVSAKGFVAKELINVSDKYIDLELLKKEIMKKEHVSLSSIKKDTIQKA